VTPLTYRLLSGLSREGREAVLKLMPRLDALGNLYARGYVVEPANIQRRFIYKFEYFQEELAFNTPPKRWLARVHPPLNCQIRLDKGRDYGGGVFVDLPKRVVEIRGFIYGKAVVLPLAESAVEYIRRRVEEGARAKPARVWTDSKHLCVGITFERKMEVRRDTDTVLVVAH